jgi:hypothetical protein
VLFAAGIQVMVTQITIMSLHRQNVLNGGIHRTIVVIVDDDTSCCMLASVGVHAAPT